MQSETLLSGPENLPQVNESQRIGRLAEKCFVANMPNEWASTNLGGTEDFGFDFQIQDLRNGYARNIFRVQLKGTLHPSLNASGEFYSISLSTSTVNLYRKTNEPVLLVLADLTVAPTVPKNCLLYYVWIHEELQRVSLDNESVTLRVPVANELTNTSNLSNEVERMLKLGSVGQALDISMEERRPDLSTDDRAILVGSIPANFAQRGEGFFEVMSETAEDSWPSPKPGTMPWYFNDADRLLKNGDATPAKAALDESEKLLAKALPLERSDYWRLRGRLFQLIGDETAARDAYAESASIPGSPPKNIVAWAESEIRLGYTAELNADFSYVLAKLTDQSPETLGARSRVLAAGGNFTEALECAASFDGVESLMAKAIIHCMQSEFEQTLAVCERALSESVSINYGRQVFLMLRARARFSLALKLIRSDYDEQLPPSGPAKTDIALILRAWDDIQAAAEELQRAGWPSNIDYLADIWSATAIMLGRHQAVLPLIRSAANARPHLANLQRALEMTALHCGELDLALEANLRLPFDDVSASHRVMLLHELKRDGECVAFFEQMLPLMNLDLPTFGDAASMATLSAHRIVNTRQREAWLSMLNARENLRPYAALVDYYSTVEDNPLASDGAAAILWSHYEALGQPIVIAQQLIGILDPSNLIEAQRCCEVANRLKLVALLNLRISLALAQALANLNEWQALLDLCVDSERRFSKSSRLAGFQALALEKLGHTSEAFEALTALIAQGVSDPLAINTYINIVVRCGFGLEAVGTVSAMLSAARTKDRKLDCLRLLFNLVHMADPRDSRVFDYALRYGALCDPADEIDEGMFLSMILRARLSMATTPKEIENGELNQRYDAFFARFPESNIIRQGEVYVDASGDDVMRVIKKLVGDARFDQERMNLQIKLGRELQRGEAPLPYAWRPRNVLINIGSLPLLWEIGKQSKHGERQYQLVMASLEWKSIPILIMQAKIPLLDLTALLVVHDLEIFELLFKIFPKIAISKATVAELANLAMSFSGDAIRDKCAAMMKVLRANFERILQPHAAKPDGENYFNWASEEIKSIVANDEFQLYSDDMFFRVYCSENRAGVHELCTLDIISVLVDSGSLTASEAAKKIATLCGWKVGVAIEPRYLAHVLPASLDQAVSPDVANKRLRGDADATAVFNSIWDPAASFEAILTSASVLLSELILVQRASEMKIVAALGLWCSKAKLRPDSNGPVENVALLIAWTAMRSKTSGSEFFTNLRSVYFFLVEMEHGDRMDEGKEKDAIVTLGHVSSTLDRMLKLQADNRLLVKLGATFTPGASAEGAYLRGYTTAESDAAAKSYS